MLDVTGCRKTQVSDCPGVGLPKFHCTCIRVGGKKMSQPVHDYLTS